MISFTCDYNEGTHPEILRRLVESNMEQHAGYGDDIYTQSAIAKIRQAVGRQAADVFLLVGLLVYAFIVACKDFLWSRRQNTLCKEPQRL